MSVTPRTLNEQEHKRIAEAVRAAEERTSGEIYCVVAHTSDNYFFPAGFIVTLAILIISFVLANLLEAWWFQVQLPMFVAAQVLAVACGLLVLSVFPRLRIHFVPRRLRYRRAHENAMKQFLARNVHITAERTGVLIFVSMPDHIAEIVADSGIYAKVAPEHWGTTIAALLDGLRAGRQADGFIAAIGLAGAVLAEHFPPRADDFDELPNRLIEL